MDRSSQPLLRRCSCNWRRYSGPALLRGASITGPGSRDNPGPMAHRAGTEWTDPASLCYADAPAIGADIPDQHCCAALQLLDPDRVIILDQWLIAQELNGPIQPAFATQMLLQLAQIFRTSIAARRFNYWTRIA